ncbi:MAG: hypothetical protein ACSHX8_12650 [Opitutaceae bacterium]
MISRQARALHLRGTLSLLLSLSLCAFSAAAGLTPEEHETIHRELQEPVHVTLNNNRIIPGHSINVSGDQIQIGTSEGAGEIIFTFDTNEVDSFKIPGESYKTLAAEWIEADENEKAIELLELLYNQRVQMIPLLPASESHFFIYYVELILQSDNPARAIAVTEVLRPQIDNPAAIRALDDAILSSYHQLELHEQARSLAEAWVESRSPYQESALGYYVLGTNKLRAEDFDGALELALKPIIFSSPTPKDQLDACYAVAISAALALRDKEYALTLYQEMQERGFDWPKDDTTLAPYYKTILEETTDT